MELTTPMPSTDHHLSPQLADKLAKVCGMFGSDHDGEVLVAARTAHRMVKEAGATWPEVLTPALRDPDPKPRREQRAEGLFWAWPTEWRRAIKFCARNIDLLDQRDANFVWSINRYDRTPSGLQCKWLRDVCTKLIAKGCWP
jgi:hypothetical protein